MPPEPDFVTNRAHETPPTQPVNESDLRARAEHGSQIDLTPRFGPYLLLREIGQGGMGTVWLASQEQPIKRTVALKVIRPEFAVGEMLVRFEAERQALAMMNHPNVAQILDAGTTPDGQPYFAMEYVEGKPLNTYCDEQRLSVQSRLQLFLDVCAGVQHAHQKGIIHRDLKPNNILVATEQGAPVVKVIDFGLAKAIQGTDRLTEQSLFTQIGQVLGTYQYMSPEQANLNELDIDTRTDVYALGVILYELLTGCTPLDMSTLKGMIGIDILRMIRDYEPVKPSSRLSTASRKEASSLTSLRQTDSRRLQQILLGDLDWIVMCALEKDRSRRYDSVTSFADDVQRYINSEPIAARPPSVVYRIRKFARKYRGAAASISFAGTVLVIASAVSIYAAFSYKYQEQLAKDNLAVADQRLQEMDDARYVMQRLFSSLDAETAKASGLTIDSILSSKIIILSEEISARDSGNIKVKATTLHGLAEILLSLQLAHDSLQPFELAHDIKCRELGSGHEESIACAVGLARALLLTGDRQRALKLSKEQFEQLDSAAVSKSLKIKILAIYLKTLAEMGKKDELQSIAGKARTMLESAILTLDFGNVIHLLELLMIISNEGSDNSCDGLFELLTAQINAKNPGSTPSSVEDILTRVNCNNVLGSRYLRLRQPEVAHSIFENADLEIREQGWTKLPIGVSVSLNIAECYLQMGEPDECIERLENAIEFIKSDLGNLGGELIPAENNLGNAYVVAGRFDDAENLFNEITSRMESQNATTDRSYLRVLNNWTRARLKSNDPESALEIVERAYRIRFSQFGETHVDTLQTLRWKGRILRDQGQIERSVETLLEVMRFASKDATLTDIGIEILETIARSQDALFDPGTENSVVAAIASHSEHLGDAHKQRIVEVAAMLKGRLTPDTVARLIEIADSIAE